MDIGLHRYYLLFGYLIVFGKHHGGLKKLCLFKVHEGIRHDDNRVAHQYLTSSCSVKAYLATATFALNDVGFKPLTIIVVYNLHLFARNHVGRIQQIFVYGDAAHIIDVGLGNRHTVQL